MLLKMETLYIITFLFLVGMFLSQANGGFIDNDKEALLEFMNNIPHSRCMNWNEYTSVCTNWTGVSCNEDGSRVTAVRLPGVGLHGPIPGNTLSRLTALQILSLRSNGISGPFPFELLSLKNLSYLYLQFNSFSGPLPLDLSVWENVTSINLSNNAFNGSIPSSISNLTHLLSLNLANNSLSGEIPDFNLPGLEMLNLSNNKLNGSVPKSLQRFPSSGFFGNEIDLSYSPAHGIPIFAPPLETNGRKDGGKLSERALLGIIVAGCVVGVIGFAFLFVVCCFKRKSVVALEGKFEKGGMSPEKAISRSQDANNRLVFFEGCSYVFDLEDLLRASAEVLGKGTFGMAYKAILEDGTSVVVKRLKDVGVGKREFEQQMELVGSIKHENLVELRAYYYSKDEKLMVCDYHSQGSVAALIHGMFLSSFTSNFLML